MQRFITSLFNGGAKKAATNISSENLNSKNNEQHAGGNKKSRQRKKLYVYSDQDLSNTMYCAVRKKFIEWMPANLLEIPAEQFAMRIQMQVNTFQIEAHGDYLLYTNNKPSKDLIQLVAHRVQNDLGIEKDAKNNSFVKAQDLYQMVKASLAKLTEWPLNIEGLTASVKNFISHEEVKIYDATLKLALYSSYKDNVCFAMYTCSHLKAIIKSLYFNQAVQQLIQDHIAAVHRDRSMSYGTSKESFVSSSNAETPAPPSNLTSPSKASFHSIACDLMEYPEKSPVSSSSSLLKSSGINRESGALLQEKPVVAESMYLHV
jgi:hypothetical protein